MHASLPIAVTRHATASPAAIDLTHIFDPEVQLAQWLRPVDTVISDWLETHVDALGCGFRQSLARGARPDLGGLPPGPGRDALADDLSMLVDMLRELLDADRVGVRLEVVRKAMCPRLHVDRVGVRMLCTYRGEGTEWVDETHVDRRFLGAAAGGASDECSGLLNPGHRIESIPPFAVALLKGSLWQGNAGRGIVHRSPVVARPPRVLVALDAGWDC
ncbi:MAG: DUF1826 domain-containing protein [Zoogloea sp.]|nr:DUF1826 domain-containing protein [Zoogloea sp.]